MALVKLLLRNTFSIRKTKCANLSFGVVAKGLSLLTQSKIVDSANAMEVAAESVPPASPNQGRGRSAFVNSPRSLGIQNATNRKPASLIVVVAENILDAVEQVPAPSEGPIGRGTPPVAVVTSEVEVSNDVAVATWQT